MNGLSGDRPAILVIDDNPQNRALVDATLEDEDYRVVLATSGEEGLAAFAKEPFDCVLLDIRMPGMNGFEVCRRMRTLPHGGDAIIVFFTALREVDAFDEALAAGGDDFLTKPLRPTELLVRVQAALELRRLSAENRGYYATMREQRDALVRLQLQKEQLTAFLVHDLKNPVNALDLHAQMLLRDASLSERGKASAHAIRQEASRLTQLITGMLDISKGDAGELGVRRGSIALAAFTEELCAEFAVRAQGKNVTLAHRIELESLEADPELLRRLLANLLDNAIRYAPPGSTILLSGRRGEDGVELCVADQGAGVPEHLREAVFERFVQAGGAPDQRGSYGLGLAFCRLVAIAHGGAIAVEDGAPGAVFRVRLPDGS